MEGTQEETQAFPAPYLAGCSEFGENSSPLRLRPRLSIRYRSHACEPGHVADLVTTAVQGPRAARSGGWEISSGRANHKGHPLSSTTPDYHSLHHTTPTTRSGLGRSSSRAVGDRASDLDRPGYYLWCNLAWMPMR